MDNERKLLKRTILNDLIIFTLPINTILISTNFMIMIMIIMLFGLLKLKN